MDENIIMMDSPEAASFRGNISGWVSRNGIFYGKDERGARYAGATHRRCDENGCEELVKKCFLFCPNCTKKRDIERHEKRERKLWDEESPLYSEVFDEWFFDWEGIEEFLEDWGEDVEYVEDLRLVLTFPEYAHELDPNEIYIDILLDDGEVEGELADAFEELNRKIREYRTPLSWRPSQFAAIVKQYEEGETT